MKHFLTFLFGAFIYSTVIASEPTIKSSLANEIEVCGDPGDMHVSIENTYRSKLSNVIVEIELPVGIQSSMSSFISNKNIRSITLGTNGVYVVAFDSIAVQDSIELSLSYTAKHTTIQYQKSGYIFRNKVRVKTDSFSVNHISESYNILYPVLLLQTSAQNSPLVSGSSSARTFKITNTGFGKLRHLDLNLSHSRNSLYTDSISHGTLNYDSLYLGPDDFKTIGNMDSIFDQNETIEITEYYSVVSCKNEVITTTVYGYWGCDSNITESSKIYLNQTVLFKQPSLKLIANSSFNTCLSEGGSPQLLQVINTGNGMASNIKIDIFKSLGQNYDEAILTQFDLSSFQYKVGASGSLRSLDSFSFKTFPGSTLASCFSDSSVGRVNVWFQKLAPNDTLYIMWNTFSCCTDNPDNDGFSGWKATSSYVDVCETSQYSSSIIGEKRSEHFISFMTETPIEIESTKSTTYTYIVDGFKNTLPAGPGSHYVATITLDSNIVYNDIQFSSNNVIWSPKNIDYNPTTNVITVTYPSTIPFTLNKSELTLSVKGVCGVTGWKNINLRFGYVLDTTCTNSCIIPLNNDLEVTSLLQCPGANCDGLLGLSFVAERLTTGLPDNNLDGRPDGSGVLNEKYIKRNRAAVGDTISMKYDAMVVGNSQYTYARLTSDIEFGKVLDLINTKLSIYDSSTGQKFILNIDPLSNTVAQNDRKLFYDLSQTYLSSLDTNLSNYKYSPGDSISIQAFLIVEQNSNSPFKEITILNESYLSNVSNPTSNQQASCIVKHGRISLVGHYWLNGSNNNVTVHSCSNKVKQNFGLSIGNTNANYAGGNLFPFEYRQFGVLERVKVKIPENYEVVKTDLRYIRTKKTNAVVGKNVTISHDSLVNDTLYYNIEKLFTSGELVPSDDGFNGFLSIEFAANCDVPKNNFQPVEWYFKYKTDVTQMTEESFITASNPDKIRYLPSSLEVICAQPKQKTISRKIEWDYQVKNTTSNSSDHSWIHIKSPSNIIIDSILDVQSQTKLSTSSDIYVFGTVGSNSTRTFKIFGTLTNCDTANVKTFVGYECTGYPKQFSEFSCDVVPFDLYIEPVASDFQTRIAGELMPNPCTPLVDLKLDVLSVGIGNMYDMSIQLLPKDISKIEVLKDSSHVRYNVSNPNTIDIHPILDSSIYTYDVNDFDTAFAENGIPGALDLANNRFYLYSTLLLGNNFIQGDYLEVIVSGKNACGDVLSKVHLAYDPNVKFSKDNTSGLHLDIGNSWSGSWGDYDNDGYDDLFIPVNDLNKPNILYHNNGKGGFSKVTTGAIVTDKGASISGTWGDYDNDGYLDLFVTNNINSPNRLYHNNGNGSFSRVLNNSIVQNGIYSHAAAWADYNGDGNLDLVVSDFHASHFNYLFQGDGKGGFEIDKSSQVSLSANSSIGVAWGDYDNDGDQDLFVANTNNENNQLFQNNNGVLQAISSGPVVSDRGNSVGGTWGDYDNDGDLDLFVTNSATYQPNFFYENNGDGTFTKINTGLIATQKGASHGASWIDYDNDGDIDLIVANDQNQRNYLYSNNGDKTFTSIENAITAESNDSYGTAWSDYDRDGDYDLLIINRGNNSNDFFKNSKGSCTNHIVFKLDGCNSNKFGIGALIKVKATIDGVSKWQTRHISTQTSALGGQNSSTILFGVNDAQVIDSVIIKWPSGIVTNMDSIPVNSTYTIREQCGSKVSGFIYHEVNGNDTFDNNEQGIPNQALEVNPGKFKVFTNSNGAYSLYLSDGIYTITQKQDSNWLQTSPGADSSFTLTINKAVSSEYKNVNFGDSSVCTTPELHGFIGSSAFRRGLINKLNLSIFNDGAYATTDSIVLKLRMSPEIYIVDTSMRGSLDSLGNRCYSFLLSPIEALSDTLINFKDSIDVYAQLEDTLFISLTIDYKGGECNSSNNYFMAEDIVVGSIDPNDKQVFVPNCKENNAISRSDRIMYKIRFQNVGNYEAQMVHIYDTLSDLLDWNTLQLESTSHPFNVSFVNGVLSWSNLDIALPDSNTNLLLSMGFVSFSIFPKPEIPPHSVIYNNAQIQFDRNDYITTNTTRIVLRTINHTNRSNTVLAYPNPTQRMVTIQLIGQDYIPKPFTKISLLSNSGTVLKHVTGESTNTTLNLGGLPKGLYFIRVTDTDKSPFYTRIILY